jgi:hypothetical protein
MLRDYFQIIRKALSESRIKGEVYYEAHHIVPKSFNKKSSTVLLTPQEHYECHRILAQELGKHSTYGQKMLWAFHRLAYDKQRKLTADEYAEARLILMTLWKRKFTEEHKEKIKSTRGFLQSRPNTWTNQPILQYDLDGTFMREFGSQLEASYFLQVKGDGVGACCRGKQKSAYGYVWKFKNK